MEPLSVQMNPGRDPKNGSIGIRLRKLRNVRRLTLEQVATGTALSASFLSLLERGQTDVSVLRLERLLDYYGISLSEFFLESEDVPTPEILPIAASQSVDRGDGVTYRIMRRDHPQVIFVRLDPWSRFSDLRAHRGEDFWILIEGHATLLYGDHRFRVEPESTVRIAGSIPHAFENDNPDPASLVVVATIPYW